MPLSDDLRQYNANGNAIGAERMLCRAADAIDSLSTALLFVLRREKLTTAEQAVVAQALFSAGVDFPESRHAHR